MNDAEEVAVIGSGPSGLAAAFRLQQAGYRVKIFEANHSVGGKMKTVHRDGYLIEEGPSIMSTAYRAILGVVEDAGLSGELVPGGSVFGFPRDGRLHYLDTNRLIRSAARFELLSNRSKLALGKLLADCLRHRKFLDSGDLPALAALDHESAADYARRRLNDEVLQYLVSPALRALAGNPPELLSSLDLLYCFRSFLAGAKFVAFRDGMGSYAEALGRRFAVVLDARVRSVEESGAEVHLTWRDDAGVEHVDRFAGCVLAVSAHQAAGVHAGLDSWRAEFLRRVRYTSIVNLSIGLSQEPRTLPAAFVLIPAAVSRELIVIACEHRKAPGRAPAGKGLVGIYPSAEWSRELYDEDDDSCIKRLLDAADQIVPGLSDDVELTHLTRWDTVVLQSRPGYWRELAEFNRIRTSRDRRIQLAGDYFCTSTLDSATAAGERAARNLRTALISARRQESAIGRPTVT